LTILSRPNGPTITSVQSNNPRLFTSMFWRIKMAFLYAHDFALFCKSRVEIESIFFCLDLKATELREAKVSKQRRIFGRAMLENHRLPRILLIYYATICLFEHSKKTKSNRRCSKRISLLRKLSSALDLAFGEPRLEAKKLCNSTTRIQILTLLDF
jgi:hypothetical protein